MTMGRMTEAECAASTNEMLDRLGATPESGARAALVDTVVEDALGWPQHLHCAQQEATRALRDAKGVMPEVDLGAVRRASSGRRTDYYQERLGHGDLKRWPVLAAAVGLDVMRREVLEEPGLWKVCRGEIERLKPDKDPDFDIALRDFVGQMLDRGLLSPQAAGRRYGVPIPSMETWLSDVRKRCRDHRPID